MQKGGEAQALLDAGRVAEARRAIKAAIATRDDIIDLHLLSGRIETAAHEPGLAFVAYNNALLLDSSNGEALLGVAHFGMQSGNLRESETAADRVLTLDPTQPDALLIKGIYNIVHFRGEPALANAQAILDGNASSEGGTILKVRALSILDRRDEALQLIEAARKASGPTLGIARTLLEFYRLNNDGPAMVQQFAALRRYLPKDKALMFDEANTHYKLGDTARARAILRGLILDRRLGDGNARLVTDLWTEYDPEPLDAASLAEVGTQGSPQARKAVARFYLVRNDPAKARQALGRGTFDADMLAIEAQASIAEGRVAPGLSVADQILQRDKTNCDALLARGQALLASRRYNDAVITSQLANTDCPRLTRAYGVLAMANAAENQNSAAEMAFRTGLSRNSQDSGLTRLYTSWLEKSGKGGRAASTARRLTNAAPALVSGWQLYLEICERNPDSDCTDEAKNGLESAKRRYAVDRRPDDPEPPGLFSRLENKNDGDATGNDFNPDTAARWGQSTRTEPKSTTP